MCREWTLLRRNKTLTRTDARELMMQVFFQMESCGDFNIDNRESYFKEKKFGNQKEYCEELFSIICNNREEIDAVIEENSTGWKLNRLPKTDLAVLRLAVSEIRYMEDIPAKVSINEAVDLAHKFGTDESGKFVNAVLAKVVK